MFVKLTRSGTRTYAQLVEAFRDDSGKPRQRTLATLGRLDEPGGQLDAVIDALVRAKGRDPGDLAAPQVRFESALALGDVWALDELWRELGFDELARVFRRARYSTPIEHALRVMVFNRLCDPDSKLGVLRWLQTVRLGSMRTEEITHQQLLRSMDALMDHQDSVDACVAGLLRPLIDDELSVVFYDLTTITVHGEAEVQGEIRAVGHSKDGGVARQVVLSLAWSRSRSGVDVMACLRAMVFNRLCDPSSKLGVLRWLPTCRHRRSYRPSPRRQASRSIGCEVKFHTKRHRATAHRFRRPLPPHRNPGYCPIL